MRDNILLIGGNGFLGTQIAKFLLNMSSYNVFVYDKFENPQNKADCTIGDASDVDRIKEIIIKKRINVIIYLISTLIPASTGSDFIKDINIVYIPLNELLLFSAKNDIKFIYFSSGGTVYGSQSGILNEKAETLPISFYGLQKTQIENLILFYNRQFNLKYLILRPSNPYGYGQNINGKQGLIAVALGKIVHDEVLDIYGDGKNIRDYIFIEDFCFYIFELLKLDLFNKILNVGSGIGYSINEVLEKIECVTQKKININRKKSRSVDVNSIIMDITELNSIIPYKQHSLEDGIYDFYRKLINE